MTRKVIFVLVFFIPLLSIAGPVPSMDFSEIHKKNKLQFFKAGPQVSANIDTFVQSLVERSGLEREVQLSLKNVRESLLAHHYSFQEVVNGVPVHGSGVQVSVNKRNGRVMKTYSTVSDVPATEVSLKTLVSEAVALDVAAKKLKVFGRLLEQPKVRLVYKMAFGALMPIQEVKISTEGPFGYWQVDINALNGEVINVEDLAIPRKNAIFSLEQRLDHGKKAADIFSLMSERNKHLVSDLVGIKAQGSGYTFDPDPMTTLNRDDFSDDSSPSEFEPAYFQVQLKDITFDGSVYHLEGPWVKILDFESPKVNPSTSSNGSWNAKRGDVAFNDTMTYYHVDRNQRYIQSLGFKGESGIQFGPIEVDANGLHGADNSHYIPGSNRMAFGHGCVDDNEDADVILHEYGHAINFSINDDWWGGDTGAMGEGFGDYWAASDSLAAANGREFQPFKVFNWDGIEECWSGRRLDKLEAKYVHSKRYTAHSRIGDFISDELWSTPIFQALFELTANGVPRGEVDQIILEAQFGLGSGVKMRDMARSVVETAQALFPNGPHKMTFEKHFQRHEIIEP